MSVIDWWVLGLALLAMVGFGVYKSRGAGNMDNYLRSGRSMPWYTVLFGVMATQASAITFLSGPGQAYTDGMRFVQFYLGLPLAMIVICIWFIPAFSRLSVYTAYEYLETRFDHRSRLLTSLLFLLQRGLSTGISIYAPSIILSSLLGWDIFVTNLIMGGSMIIYTLTGGAKAISHTQQYQFLIIIGSMVVAGVLVVQGLPEGVGVMEALQVSGKLDKLNALSLELDMQDRYNLWSGIIGGFFLQLSYFGTDQSQVGRYIGGKNQRESKLGLLLNGAVKIPMQFLILLLGILVFAFYQFNPTPLVFNPALEEKVLASGEQDKYRHLQEEYARLSGEKSAHTLALSDAIKNEDPALVEAETRQLKGLEHADKLLRKEAKRVIQASVPGADVDDTNYVFLNFVMHYLPVGLVGLLIAVIFAASWNSCSAALNSLAASSLVDIHRRYFKPNATDAESVRAGRWFTAFWGVFCIITAMFASQLGSLLEAVNILGSLFYGVILGVFLVAFWLPRVKGTSLFYGAILAEVFVLLMHAENLIAYLWLNLIGAVLVMLFSSVLEVLFPEAKPLEEEKD